MQGYYVNFISVNIRCIIQIVGFFILFYYGWSVKLMNIEVKDPDHLALN